MGHPRPLSQPVGPFRSSDRSVNFSKSSKSLFTDHVAHPCFFFFFQVRPTNMTVYRIGVICYWAIGFLGFYRYYRFYRFYGFLDLWTFIVYIISYFRLSDLCCYLYFGCYFILWISSMDVDF